MERFLSLLVSGLLLGTAVGAEYRGNVGKLAAVFELEFEARGKVSGSYHYPDRPGVVYRLTGTNPETGHIVLDEYTGKKRTARCDLWKTVTDSEITWSGMMYNADGREFAMRFSRPRKAADPPPPPAAEPDFELEIDRTLHAENVLPVLGKPDDLEAHLYGKLYYGWIATGEIPRPESLEALVGHFRSAGDLVWSAMRFDGEKVEWQFEDTSGRREILRGTNPEDGLLQLRDGEKVEWEGRKLIAGDAIIWFAVAKSDPQRTLLVYRPRNEIYYRGFEDMKALAPEAFIWQYNEWGNDFFEKRFPWYSDEVEKATVSDLEESGGRVTSVTFRPENGAEETVALDPPRDRNRVPIAEGFPVELSRLDGKIVHLLVCLQPMAWRQRGDHVLELKLFPFDLAEVTWNDFGDPVIPPGKLETLTKVDVVPDYAVIADFIYASWHIPEDKITWGIGDRGAGILELESLSLEGPSSPAERIGPWHPISEPIDIITNQLRIVNMSTTSGFGWVLPGNEPP